MNGLSGDSAGLEELTTKLTNVAFDEKETPPATPRGTTSTGSIAFDTTAPTSAGSSERPSRSLSRAPSTNGPPGPKLGPPRGKLVVKLHEARNLITMGMPYVVCTFESNEFISKGPTMEENNNPFGGHAGKPIPAKTMAIPMRSTSSPLSTPEIGSSGGTKSPTWGQEAVFDVLGDHSEVDVSVYDANQEKFLGHVRFCPLLKPGQSTVEWYQLESRNENEKVSGQIRLEMRFEKITKKHYGPDDFERLRLIGKGTFGQVYQVRKKDTGRIYAMKILSKKVVVQKKEVAHTLGERNILVRTATTDSPFIVGLKFSFQTPTDLYLVTDYMSGGELFWHLQKEGRFGEQRAKFYIAELILALEHLHNQDIVYRDLKPENILLDANGHIALCDFGLSKANVTANSTTNTFCGTTEYLAPEVLIDEQGYTKMVDFWSLGVLVFEMCCGWSPFYHDDVQQMYKNIVSGKVKFPRDALSADGRNFVKGLLNRNPKHRLGAKDDARELKAHPFFKDVDWNQLLKKNVVPPFKPVLRSETDTSNFDPLFTGESIIASSLARAAAGGGLTANTPLSPTMQAKFRGFTFVNESSIDDHFIGREQLEKMDEGDDEDWQILDGAQPRSRRRSSVASDFDQNDASKRMSGVQRDDDVFNHGFEV
ncbi:Pkinase-domain-containing protein [Ascobolus immersus RN42]|uniref:non-specific serine/threonine protein kinase n=1 Tax=Ascobolus immersus RN42 TaxID=1160509 RepID=A0A3N4I5Y6_ASCIM|nr:Pkinase-domain-containing protein [Ascobolus immersus RN42]